MIDWDSGDLLDLLKGKLKGIAFVILYIFPQGFVFTHVPLLLYIALQVFRSFFHFMEKPFLIHDPIIVLALFRHLISIRSKDAAREDRGLFVALRAVISL